MKTFLAILVMTFFQFTAGAAVAVGGLEGATAKLAEAGVLFVSFGAVLLFYRVRGKSLSELGFRWPARGSLKKIYYAFPVIVISLSAMMAGIKQEGTGAAAANVLLALVVGFHEETYFRGIICNLWQKRSRRAAVLVSAVLFALVHMMNVLNGARLGYTVMQMAVAFVYGITLALIFFFTGSIWPCIWLHAFHDACAFAGRDFGNEEWMAIIWIAVFLCYIWLLLKKSGKKLPMFCLIISILALGLLWVRSWLFPECELPAPTGEYGVETALFTWEDSSRVDPFSKEGANRNVTVKIWYPAENGKYPLVVFSHGALGVIDSNYSTCQDLASRGYVVASIGHPFHAAFVKDVNGKVTFADRTFMQESLSADVTELELYENSLKWMELRTGDMNFVLDTMIDYATQEKAMSDQIPFSMIDTEKIGLFGHSMGGATSVEVGRQRDDITAVIDLEGIMLGEFAGIEDGSIIYDETPYPIPVLDVNGLRVRESIEEDRQTRPDLIYVNDYLGMNAVDYKAVLFEGTGHLNYSDLPLVSPPLAKLLGAGEVDPMECMENVNQMVCTWFDYYLKDSGTLEDIRDVY